MQVGKGQQRTMALKLLDVFQNQVTGCFLSNWAYLAIWTRREQGSSSKAKVLHWQFFKTGSRVVQLYTLISRILFLLLSVSSQETPFASEGSFIESVGLHLPSKNMLLIRYWSAHKLARGFRWKLALCFDFRVLLLCWSAWYLLDLAWERDCFSRADTIYFIREARAC